MEFSTLPKYRCRLDHRLAATIDAFADTEINFVLPIQSRNLLNACNWLFSDDLCVYPCLYGRCWKICFIPNAADRMLNRHSPRDPPVIVAFNESDLGRREAQLGYVQRDSNNVALRFETTARVNCIIWHCSSAWLICPARYSRRRHERQNLISLRS